MVISGGDVFSLVWAAGVVVQAPRILKRWSLITTCDPVDLCGACRDERRSVMHGADQFMAMGAFGGPLMVMLEAFVWYIRALQPAVRRVVGQEPLPSCSRGSCVAHTGVRAEA